MNFSKILFFDVKFSNKNNTDIKEVACINFENTFGFHENSPVDINTLFQKIINFKPVVIFTNNNVNHEFLLRLAYRKFQVIYIGGYSSYIFMSLNNKETWDTEVRILHLKEEYQMPSTFSLRRSYSLVTCDEKSCKIEHCISICTALSVRLWLQWFLMHIIEKNYDFKAGS